MNLNKKIFRSLGLATIVVAMTITAVAQASHVHESTAASAQKFLGKGDGITTCAVTGEKLADKSISGEFFGRTVYFCCGGCLDKAKKSPELYLKPTSEAQAVAAKASTTFLGKGDGIETCPVTGEPVKKNLKAEVNGQVFYVCCEGCIATIKSNPELYLKSKTEHAGHDHHGNADASGFLGKGDGITTCPVTGEPINASVKAEINGRTIYACCAECLAKVKASPDLYLKKN